MELKRPPARPVAQQRPVRRAAQDRKWLLALAAAVVICLAVIGHIFYALPQPRSDQYQAVFLENGQTFFGKLKNTHGTYLTLEKAYTTQQQSLPENATDEQKQAVSNNLSLVKVDSVVYGPENTMMIRADQVLFWQNLQSDSKVTKAIDSDS